MPTRSLGLGVGSRLIGRQAFNALELFADDGVGVDRSTEDPHAVDVGCGVGTGAERGRRGDRDGRPERSIAVGHTEGAAEAAQQHGDVGALGSVVGVELVEHDVAERVGGVVSPQVSVFSPQQEEVEHLVVGEQNVGRVGPKDVSFVDEVVGAHRGVASCFTDVHPGPDPGEERIVVDRFGEPAGLVGGPRVHRVEDQGFDALFVLGGGAGAVIEHRIQEAFGFA